MADEQLNIGIKLTVYYITVCLYGCYEIIADCSGVYEKGQGL